MLLSNLEVARSHMLANFFEMEPYSLSASLFCPFFSASLSLPSFITKKDDLWTHSVHSSKSYSVFESKRGQTCARLRAVEQSGKCDPPPPPPQNSTQGNASPGWKDGAERARKKSYVQFMMSEIHEPAYGMKYRGKTIQRNGPSS